jgi:hypothetical protein
MCVCMMYNMCNYKRFYVKKKTFAFYTRTTNQISKLCRKKANNVNFKNKTQSIAQKEDQTCFFAKVCRRRCLPAAGKTALKMSFLNQHSYF